MKIRLNGKSSSALKVEGYFCKVHMKAQC